MDAHPKFKEVASICSRFPHRTRILFQAFLNIKYEQRHDGVRTEVLEKVNLPAVVSASPTTEQAIHVFVPVSASEDITIKLLGNVLRETQKIFASETVESVHLAIVDNDSTVVYYKISEGLILPAEDTDVPIP